MNQNECEPSGYQTQSRDTSAWAEKLLFDHWRSMERSEKAALVSNLCKAQHELCMAGLRGRYPDESDESLELRAAEIRLGPELMAFVRGEIRAGR